MTQSTFAPPSDAFRLNITVEPEDIDVLGHVNNVIYLRWVQNLAIAHWEKAADPDDQENLVWVVVRHEIDYKRSAQLGDEILGLTWVGTHTRRTFERYSQFWRTSDNKVLAQALSVWSPVNRQTMRATDVSDSILLSFPASVA